ncbi:MAG TPA: tail fiber protein [Anaerolineales bacterium]|nr:tail fiber protein [Anaerolineales bacterium]
MAQPYVGEIRMFAGNFAPAGWMFCEGQLLPISENETLFQLIGTTYGGDGQSTFALPDLRGRIPLHQGNGFTLAETGGSEEVTLTVNQIPVHTHPLLGSQNTASSTDLAGNVGARVTAAAVFPYGTDAPLQPLSPQAVSPTGGSQPHTNFQPYLCIDFIISLFGIFPSPT